MPEFEPHLKTTREATETEQEIPLYGGNVTGAVRIGQTVHRATGIWSTTVHTLLRHLEASGFTGAPRFIGIDERGREILTFIEGEVGHYPLPRALWSEESLVAAAHFLRTYHDATLNYLPPQDAVWQFTYPDLQRHEVICHGDVAPYNMIYRRGRPHALIDFDTAGPGPRLWDLAYAAYRFVPLSYAQDMQELGLSNPLMQGPRLRLFCQTYELEQPYTEILDFVEQRLQAMCSWLSEGVIAQDPARQRLVNEGHLDYYRREIAAFQQHRPLLRDYLT
jgi:Phosphotransferase enzyme family